MFHYNITTWLLLFALPNTTATLLNRIKDLVYTITPFVLIQSPNFGKACLN